MNVWFQTQFCLRETYAAQAICYGELSKETKRSHLPSHSENWLSVAQQGHWHRNLLLPILGFVEYMFPRQLIILAYTEGVKCIYKVN